MVQWRKRLFGKNLSKSKNVNNIRREIGVDELMLPSAGADRFRQFFREAVFELSICQRVRRLSQHERRWSSGGCCQPPDDNVNYWETRVSPVELPTNADQRNRWIGRAEGNRFR